MQVNCSIKFSGGSLAGRYLREFQDSVYGAVITPTADPNLAMRATPAMCDCVISTLDYYGHPAQAVLLGDPTIGS